MLTYSERRKRKGLASALFGGAAIALMILSMVLFYCFAYAYDAAEALRMDPLWSIVFAVATTVSFLMGCAAIFAGYLYEKYIL